MVVGSNPRKRKQLRADGKDLTAIEHKHRKPGGKQQVSYGRQRQKFRAYRPQFKVWYMDKLSTKMHCRRRRILSGAAIPCAAGRREHQLLRVARHRFHFGRHYVVQMCFRKAELRYLAKLTHICCVSLQRPEAVVL